MSASELTEREVTIPDGRRLLLRPVRAGDEDGLFDLYDQLDAEDRYRRFFCAYRPSDEFLHGLANPEPDDARLVVVLMTPGQERIVAEAGYCHLPNGDGELALVVARRWRGWLGPWLLDALVDVAAGRGVPNLEADVLAANGPMLALLRARGSVVISHDDCSVMRLMIGTSGSTPTWPPGPAPRVLVETPGGRWPSEDDARALGLVAVACPGPSQQHPCPVLNGQHCPLADEADAIVVRCPAGDAEWADLLEAHREARIDTVVVDHLAAPRPGTDTVLATVASIARHHAGRRTPRRRRTDRPPTRPALEHRNEGATHAQRSLDR